MDENDLAISPGPQQHALLFAWIAQALICAVGAESGQAAIRRATANYGEQRGRRMAQRAAAHGELASMNAFMQYGEWQAEPGLFLAEQVSLDGTPRTLVWRCPWHQAWVDEGINAVGRLYCLEIDAALGRGFNPNLHLEVAATRSNSAEACQFIYHGAGTASPAVHTPDPAAIKKDWEYHLAHLYFSMRSSLGDMLGEPGVQAADEGLRQLEQRFGSRLSQAILAHQKTDFEHI
jgi:hypothetical protein